MGSTSLLPRTQRLRLTVKLWPHGYRTDADAALPVCRFQLIGRKLRNGARVDLCRPDGGIISCVVAFHGRLQAGMPCDVPHATNGEAEVCTWDTPISLVANFASAPAQAQASALESERSKETTGEGVELSIFGSDLVNRLRTGLGKHKYHEPLVCKLYQTCPSSPSSPVAPHACLYGGWGGADVSCAKFVLQVPALLSPPPVLMPYGASRSHGAWSAIQVPIFCSAGGHAFPHSTAAARPRRRRQD